MTDAAVYGISTVIDGNFEFFQVSGWGEKFYFFQLTGPVSDEYSEFYLKKVIRRMKVWG